MSTFWRHVYSKVTIVHDTVLCICSFAQRLDFKCSHCTQRKKMVTRGGDGYVNQLDSGDYFTMYSNCHIVHLKYI